MERTHRHPACFPSHPPRRRMAAFPKYHSRMKMPRTSPMNAAKDKGAGMRVDVAGEYRRHAGYSGTSGTEPSSSDKEQSLLSKARDAPARSTKRRHHGTSDSPLAKRARSKAKRSEKLFTCKNLVLFNKMAQMKGRKAPVPRRVVKCKIDIDDIVLFCR